MNLRKDAAIGRLSLRWVIPVIDGRQVGTVGKISAAPGAYNVVPGKVVLGLEIRDLSFDKIWELFHEIEKKPQI
jgi:N-carbamoyl-L-amino-acid hydrolase